MCATIEYAAAWPQAVSAHHATALHQLVLTTCDSDQQLLLQPLANSAVCISIITFSETLNEPTAFPLRVTTTSTND